MQSLGSPPIVVTLSDTSILASRSGAGFVQTATVTASASGGNGSFTYAWTRLTGDTEITAQSPSLAATRFQATVATGSLFEADFRCTVTDTNGKSGFADCNVQIQELA